MKKHEGDAPICVECRHYWHRHEHGPCECRSEDCSVLDVVNGRQPESPEKARGPDGPCGPTAKFFEPIPTPNWIERNFGGAIIAAIITSIIIWMWRQ